MGPVREGKIRMAPHGPCEWMYDFCSKQPVNNPYGAWECDTTGALVKMPQWVKFGEDMSMCSRVIHYLPSGQPHTHKLSNNLNKLAKMQIFASNHRYFQNEKSINIIASHAGWQVPVMRHILYNAQPIMKQISCPVFFHDLVERCWPIMLLGT